MKIGDFYKEHKAIIETVAFLLVITGFFLNLPELGGLPGKSLDQIKFFLVLGTGVSMTILLRDVFIFFLLPILESAERRYDNRTVKGLNEEINRLSKIIFVAAVTIAAGLLFVVNLFVYLISLYSEEFIYLVLPLIVIYLLIKLMGGGSSALRLRIQMPISVTLMIILPGIPLATYSLLYFNLGFTSIWAKIIFGVIIFLGATSYVILNRKTKSETKVRQVGKENS